jgi:hypothetical protein
VLPVSSTGHWATRVTLGYKGRKNVRTGSRDLIRSRQC